MLDLEPRVHLEEEEVATGVEQELDGPRVAVADRLGGLAARFAKGDSLLGVQARTGRLFDDLLVSPLDGALPLEQVDHALAVCENLHLHVARACYIPLENQGVVAERL